MVDRNNLEKQGLKQDGLPHPPRAVDEPVGSQASQIEPFVNEEVEQEKKKTPSLGGKCTARNAPIPPNCCFPYRHTNHGSPIDDVVAVPGAG